MVRTRQGCVVALAIGLGLITACKKDDKAGQAADKSAAQPAGGAASPAGSDDLSLLPVDSEVVVGINVAQIQQSALWKQFVEPKLNQGEVQKRMTELKTRCGYDPMAAIKSMSIGAKSGGASKYTLVAVVHGVDKAKSLECLDKSKDEMAKDGTTVTRDGDIVLLENTTQNGRAAITFLSDSTGIMAVGDLGTAAGVKSLLTGASGLKNSPTFVEMYKKVKTTDSMWLLANGKVMEKLPIGATAAYGSLNVTDGFALDGRVRLAGPEAATQMATMANGQSKQAAQFVDKAEFTAENNEVHGVVVMSNAKLQMLLQQLGPMLGMFTGGAIGGQ